MSFKELQLDDIAIIQLLYDIKYALNILKMLKEKYLDNKN